ncbi:sugar phosphate isomerase/epimerase [Nonomuraea sp. MCN248]|uniref:Sugar phosphate isomerase/epimerase n=1 Tax=Nonomuraea corallina TaxID=2989783 RepID=A0ABT4SKM5_9ACTN|nr:sugar phosphate isomerase/epimerase family protein [Nonomuraea corallina]MDA0637778.1 sugar phosphate isomerase/epimerase [Nonomuraea corallina]
MKWAYCTNGFAGHRLPEALAVLADLGYTGVAVTLDHGHLDPCSPTLAGEVSRIAGLLDRLGMDVVVETGGRYTLDPLRKHHPTLVSEDAGPRVDFLTTAMRVAADLGAPVVHLWSGALPGGLPEAQAYPRLARRCARLLDEADRVGVTLGFEPEPGMLVADLDGYERLRAMLDAHPRFGLTLDVGHCHCVEREDLVTCLRRALPYTVHVQIEDMRRGVHEHLEFGEGEIDFVPVLAALRGYTGLVAVELARHSHAAPQVAHRSIGFLRRAHERAGAGVAGLGRPAGRG